MQMSGLGACNGLRSFAFMHRLQDLSEKRMMLSVLAYETDIISAGLICKPAPQVLQYSCRRRQQQGKFQYGWGFMTLVRGQRLGVAKILFKRGGTFGIGDYHLQHRRPACSWLISFRGRTTASSPVSIKAEARWLLQESIVLHFPIGRTRMSTKKTLFAKRPKGIESSRESQKRKAVLLSCFPVFSYLPRTG